MAKTVIYHGPGTEYEFPDGRLITAGVQVDLSDADFKTLDSGYGVMLTELRKADAAQAVKPQKAGEAS